MTAQITTEPELEELLSRPDDETASAMAAMDGDLIILGAGGKMGPTLAWLAETLPSPPITRNQVELMQIDTVSSPEIPGLRELGISPHSIEEILQTMLSDR